MYRHRRPLKYQLMLLLMHPLIQLLQRLWRPTLNLMHDNRLPAIHLTNNIVNHNPRRVIDQLALVIIVVRPLDGIDAIVHAR